MLPFDFSIDLHCHPQYKPLGKSFNSAKGQQSSSPGDRSSMWFYNPPGLNTKLINFIGSLTKFSQTNLTAAAYGRVWVMVVSLGSVEKWFFNNKIGTGTGFLSDIAGNFASGLGDKRIDFIQGISDYFSDLDMEYSFIESMNDQEVVLDGKKYAYRIVHNFSELQAVINENEETLNADDEGERPIIIALIPSIEGLHVLNCGLSDACNPEVVKANAKAIKNHRHKPWFVTFSHHFYNELCGQAKSLRGFIATRCDQTKGLEQGFTDLGRDVLEILLDNTDGRRILIDVKHMSATARQEFFELRKTKFPDIPIIISHGVCNGLPDKNAITSAFPKLGNTFNAGDINFYDNEIIEMARSNGIMGLQLDERRIANDEKIRQTKNSVFRNKIMHYRSELFWNQIQYVGELLDRNGLPAWDNLAIGSDYDGIVDPLNSFWTMEEYKDLKGFVERHAHNYMKNHSDSLQNSNNKIDADIIVQNVFQNNAWKFFERWF